MATPPTPSEIARKTLTTLTSRKIAPTPDNYARVYQEISGQDGASSGAGNVSADAAPLSPADPSKLAPAWANLIRDLLKQLEIPHKGITLTRKKEGMETVLSKFANNPGVLFEKLQGLMRSWSTAPTASSPGELLPEMAAVATPAAVTSATSPAPGGPTNAEMIAQLRELLAQTLENSLSTQPELVSEIQALAQQARNTENHDQIAQLAKQLRPFWIKLELRGGDKLKIQEGLVRLLRLLVENLGGLAADDKWLHGHIATLQEIIAHPIDKHTIADAERNLRDAIIKQGLLKQSLTDAKTTLKSLMATFIDRLGDLTESTSEYHTKIKGYSLKIGQADNLTELSHILDDVMDDTRIIQDSALRSHEELLNTRKQAHAAEERVKQLEQELEQVSEKMHEDQLTGALNRRGLDETLEREVKRADRQQSSICITLLDIDNFKQLNDTMGHQAGDMALIHLTKVIKEALRPTDVVARYGGEEFLLILTDTGLEKAMETITRLQRELTKKFFMHDNKRLLITFSAGVAMRAPGEDPEEIIGRADKAMYQAKQAGRNRVQAAE